MRFDRRGFLKFAALLPNGALAEQPPVYLADFSSATPATAVSREWSRGRWRLLDYESDRGKGVMLAAGQNTAAAEITVPLNRRGWHAIWFGVRSAYGETRLQARLTGDGTFCLFTHHDMTGMRIERRDIELGGTSFHSRGRIDDLYWKAADLSGASLVLRQLTVENQSAPVWLAYVKLVPLTDAEVRNIEDDRRRTDNRRLFTHNDSFGYTGWLHPSTANEIRREIEPYRDTDFSRMYWEAGMGDRMYYPTRLGLPASDEWIRDPFRVRDRLSAESYQAFRKKGIDPMRVAAEAAHAIGLEFHATYRVAGFHFPEPERDWNRGGVYDKHPEWRGRDREGNPTPRLSYAFPEVRRYVVGLIEEMARYPVDGVCLAFNRRPPLVQYEVPLIEGFRAKHGKDPRSLPERDPEWLLYRAGVLTQFLREVRQMLDRVSRKRLGITAVVMGTEQQNLYHAMDLKTWVEEGLVDTLIPYTSGATLDSSAASFTNPADAAPFLRLTKGSRCKLAVNLMPRQIAPEDYRRRAFGLYEAGVENLFFWDCYQRCDFSRSWTALRRLGHREEIADWARNGAPKIEQPGSTLTKIGDWDLRYETPG